ncbi:hypothetical protein HRI_002051700 [Hibiscus trionum]|uniref:LysM domain-containing protein n=1 Tax=Hibiscus trionum TaxID=183268 RepID=A0A9W7M0P0_HIBTR|nr:hypothetical protein HRI_002051700 [Hibiscus trionum]
MERERRNSAFADGDGHYSCNANGHCTQFCNDYSLLHGDKVPSAAYIQHSVSRFDTLAGVEVADIKKMNGLVQDTTDPFTRAASTLTLLLK